VLDARTKIAERPGYAAWAPIAYGNPAAIEQFVPENENCRPSMVGGRPRKLFKRVYNLQPPDVKEHVYYRMTSNWVELSVRFLVPERNIRPIMSGMYLDILRLRRGTRRKSAAQPGLRRGTASQVAAQVRSVPQGVE
jgi:hypothetical protein